MSDTDIFGDVGTPKNQDDSAIFKDEVAQKVQEKTLTAAPEATSVSPRTAAWQEYKRKSGELSDNFAYETGGKVTDLTGSPALGAAANFLSNAVPALFGGQMGTALNPVTQGIGQWLMRSALKPSSTVSAQKADSAVQTLLKEGVNPTQSGVEKLQKTLGVLNGQVDQAVAKSGATVDTRAVADYVPNAYERFKNGPTAVQAAEDLGKVQTSFLEHPNILGAMEIPVQVAQDMKQGYQRAIGDRGYGELKTPTTEGEKQIARALREQVAAKVPAVVEPLKRESEIINAVKLAQRRAAVDANKNPLGLGILNPAYLPIWLWDRSTLGKAYTARLLNNNELPALAGAMGGALYGNTGALYRGE